MASGEFKITLDEKDNTEAIKAGIDIAIEAALEVIGLKAEGYAKTYETRVDTGRLRNSISHITNKKEVYVGTNVEYAIYIELGARGKAGIHYLQRAAENHKEEYRDVMIQAINQAIGENT